jgi:hypothetical protein
VFGSCVAYATYFWLVPHDARQAEHDRLREPGDRDVARVAPSRRALTGTQLAGMVVILTGIVLVVWQRRPLVEGPSVSEAPSTSAAGRT